MIPVVCIVGPTASGKSELAQCVAERIGGEIVSADSMQIYRGMDIGTGKVTPDEQRVPHWGLDLVDPGEAYSAALFQSYARDAFAEIHNRGNVPILCGGTGLYIRSAIDDFQFPAGEQVDNPIRAQYTAYAEEHGADALWDLLNERDPESAAYIHPNNVRRVVRAFELMAEGSSYAVQKENLAHIPQSIPAVFFGLSVTPSVLAERIDSRVDSMFREGLVEEVQSLLDAGFRSGITAPQAIGYKEIVSALDGECSMDEACESIKTATRRYAKRQRTWFKKDLRIDWLEADDYDASILSDEVCKKLAADAFDENIPT